MSEKEIFENTENLSDDLKKVIEVFSRTASNITSDIEDAMKFADTEDELKKILKETLKNTKENIDNLIKKLDREEK